MSVLNRLEPIKTKRIDDDLVFNFDSNQQLFLQRRTQNCWDYICEWFARTFTSKMPQLRQQFEMIVNDFEIYLGNETDEEQRKRALIEYAPVINEIFRCAERMKAAGIKGFSNVPSLMRGPRTSAAIERSIQYLIQAYLPRDIYLICKDRDLLPLPGQHQRRITEQEGRFTIDFLPDRHWVNISYLPREAQQEGFALTFSNRVLTFFSKLLRAINGQRLVQVYDLDSWFNHLTFNRSFRKNLKITLDRVHTDTN